MQMTLTKKYIFGTDMRYEVTTYPASLLLLLQLIGKKKKNKAREIPMTLSHRLKYSCKHKIFSPPPPPPGSAQEFGNRAKVSNKSPMLADNPLPCL